ncbi:MAG: hypothetical protein AAGA66_15190, partial [Bacteroidota bacterium]
MKFLIKCVCLSIVLFSCNSENNEVTVNGLPVEVSFTFDGDISYEDETPIDGRIENDLGTVFGVTINKSIDGNESFYLEGVFNSLDNMKVDLFSDESYVIYISALQNGTSLGLAQYESNGGIYFNRLFGESDLELNNQFVDNEQFINLPSNSIASYYDENIIEDAFLHALIDRFNGKLEVISPTESDSVITIDLKRTSFGLAIRAENIDANDTLTVDLFSAGSTISYKLFNNEAEGYQIRTVNEDFTISDDQTATFQSEFNLKIYDESNQFVRERLLSTQSVTGKRNIKRTYVI